MKCTTKSIKILLQGKFSIFAHIPIGRSKYEISKIVEEFYWRIDHENTVNTTATLRILTLEPLGFFFFYAKGRRCGFG